MTQEEGGTISHNYNHVRHLSQRLDVCHYIRCLVRRRRWQAGGMCVTLPRF